MTVQNYYLYAVLAETGRSNS